MKKPVSIKIKLTFTIMVVFLIVTVFFTGCLVSISNSVYKRTLETELTELVSNNVDKIKGIENGKLIIEEGFIYELSGSYTSVFSKEGSLLAGTLPIGFSNTSEFLDRKLRIEEGDNANFLILDVYYPLDWENGLWVRGFSEMADRKLITKNLLLSAGFTLPFFLVVIGLLSYFLAKSSLKPLETVNQAAAEINDGGDLKKRINLQNAPYEFIELSTSMDSMLDRIENAFEVEKRFTSNVSHELRTPISVIKSAAEYSLKYDEGKEWVSSMEIVKRNADSMGEMTENLLMLSRMELGTIKSEFKTFDFSNFLAETLDTLPQETIRNIEPNHYVHGDTELLKNAIKNLVENAKKYGKENGHIIVSLTGDSKHFTTLSVKDDGIGIEKEKIPYIFDRFYRGDESRNSKVSGSGLGLSIVYEIIKLHGAAISCDSIPGVGTEFKIIFKK